MIELEKTFLAKSLPPNLQNCKFKEIIDIYIPKESEHPKLRLRTQGEIYELTKKLPVHKDDYSNQIEQTIILDKEEFGAFLEKMDGKRVRKLRYYFDFYGKTAEIDIFQDDLLGLVVIEFEFASEAEKDNFPMPDFCLADITQEKFIAGGQICGKTYKDIETNLEQFNYHKLYLN